MATFATLDIGKIGLIQQTETGRIVQIGLTTEQSEILQNLLAILSKDSPLIRMDEAYDFLPICNVCNKCKNK